MYDIANFKTNLYRPCIHLFKIKLLEYDRSTYHNFTTLDVCLITRHNIVDRLCNTCGYLTKHFD